MTGLPFVLFLLSGISGLVYQVIWVRVFGNVFGNTVHSASTVVAIFMLGLGVGSYAFGAWADRQYASRGASLLRAYGAVELVIAAAGLALAFVLPQLGTVSAMVSTYTQAPSGWFVLSAGSYAARGAIAVLLLTPITLLMGGTLTLLIRHLVRQDLVSGGWRIGLLYTANTVGAAIGAVSTDFLLVPTMGLLQTQLVAVAINVVAGLGALAIARGERAESEPANRDKRRKPTRAVAEPVLTAPAAGGAASPLVTLTGASLAMAGFAAMGMEILWFRHMSMLLGGFRAVYSLLLAVILLGIAAGSLIGGALDRRTQRPAEWFVVLQGLFVAATLLGLGVADVRDVNAAQGPSVAMMGTLSGFLGELWFNARPMVTEVLGPAVLMGCTFPLANGVIQRAEASVGRRAGLLYLANTWGAVAGSLVAGFILLPHVGLQAGALTLMVVAALAVIPLVLGVRTVPTRATAAAILASGAAIVVWGMLPNDFVLTRALSLRPGEELVTVSEGVSELVAVTEQAGKGRTLVTNGHQMSSTQLLSQRYMRALAHLPLLAIERPRTVLVIGFGVGNTTQAATLHPSVERVDLADISQDILAHAPYFREANRDVLQDPRVAVHINDGRQHLQMRPPDSYDLITLEPPPIAYAGVGALYSREFYTLARTRLRDGGYLSQWLPAYQVPPETTLAMVKAFIDVFPEAVLLSGAESDLLLLGAKNPAPSFGLDPDRLSRALAAAPDVRKDLAGIDLGQIHELVGTFVGSAQTLARATQSVSPSTDDRPVQEYGVRSMLNFGRGVPADIVDLTGVSAWCPRCVAGDAPSAATPGLETYMALLELAYGSSRAEMATTRALAERDGRRIGGSRYLGMIVPESSATHKVLGIALASGGQIESAIREFQRATELDDRDAVAQWHLGAALFQAGDPARATTHLTRSVELDSSNSDVWSDLGLVLAAQGRFPEARSAFERAVALDPNANEAATHLERLRQGAR